MRSTRPTTGGQNTDKLNRPMSVVQGRIYSFPAAIRVHLSEPPMEWVASLAMTNDRFRMRPIDPTGKSLLIFRNRVKPRNQKYFA